MAGAGASPWRGEGARRVIAFADVHGAHDELVELLGSLGILDGALRWSGADTHLVGLVDLVDRGPDSRRVLDLLMRLEGEARAVLKKLSTDFGATHLTQSLNEGDRFELEIAAYELDRLLGLGMVPVTVPRTVNGQKVALQFWG